jgi:methylase of polypeptide subunit release factors
VEIRHQYKGISYLEDPGVYPVERDSLFMLEIVEKEIPQHSTLMDMGCGTGLITLIATAAGMGVVSVDREPRSLMLLRRNLQINGLDSELYLSDLFDGVPRSYHGWAEIITFNPPYLTDDNGIISTRGNLPLTGGKKGWETASEFLNNCGKFLAPDGKVILLCPITWSIADLDPCNFLGYWRIRSSERDLDGEKFNIFILERPKTNIDSME